MDSEIPTTPTKTSDVDPWQEYLHWAMKFVDWPDWDAMERTYKLEIGERLVNARLALLGDDADWYEQLRVAITNNNLMPWQSADTIRKWCQQHPEVAQSTLRIIWDEDRSVRDRFNDFVAAAAEQGLQVRIAEASTLHIAMGPEQFPVLRAEPVKKSYELVEFAEDKSTSSNLGARYEHYLEFLDELLKRSRNAGIELRDRLDAQSLIWCINKQPLPEATAEEKSAFDRYRGLSGKDGDTTLAAARQQMPAASANEQLASDHATTTPRANSAKHSLSTFESISSFISQRGLRISPRTLRRYHLSLTTRGFVILAGVSGTGKTWLAESYADAVGAEHRLVSVAPNWTTNEDLLGFYNPVTERYHHTPTSTFIREAADAWHSDGLWARPYHLILDEMNLARVEYYFASFLSKMEARVRYGTASIDIGDGDTLELTPNLYVIGTVNIDETTHGFADKVWDRAQLVELDLPREEIAAHIADQPYADDVLAIWDAVHMVGPFAYRVVDDIVNYTDGANTIGVPWEEALDEQILQKILPKLKGTNPDVVPALEHLVEMLNDRYPLSHERAQQMLEGIRQYGFASYFG